MIAKTEQSIVLTGSPFLLHASSIEINGEVLIFLGHSTAGKSTISKILSTKYPLFTDDKIFLFKEGEKWYAVKGDRNSFEFSQKEINKEKKKALPVLSFVRIYKAKKMQIEKIDSLELCRNLIDAVFEVDYQRNNSDLELRKKWFFSVTELSKKIPGWSFDFKKNSSIIEIIKETFEK